MHQISISVKRGGTMKVFVVSFGLVVGLVLLISVMPLAAATASESEKPLKIGYVDLQKALNDSQAGQKAKKTLTELIAAKQKSVDEKGTELEKLRAELDKQATVLSPDAKKQKEEKLERDIRDYQRMVRDTQEELQKKESELTSSIIKDLREIIKNVGEEEGYTVILEQAEGVILYSSPTYDLTEKVIKRYDQQKK
jgi:outer membrane protein